MHTAEQYMEVIGRDIYISRNLKHTLQQGDSMSEKIEINLPRYYDDADLSTKQVTLYVRTPVNKVVQINLDDSKVVRDEHITYDFFATSDMTEKNGWLDIVIVAIDQLGYRWSTKQVSNAIYVGASC